MATDPEERALIEGILGPVHYLADGTAPADVALSIWPRSELRKAGIQWSDIAGLQWIKLITAGANHAGWRDIPASVGVMSTPGATGPVIAEYILGAIIAWARGFQSSTHDIRAGDFRQGAAVRGLSELKIGFVDHGGIGQASAAMLQGFGAEVRAVSRTGTARLDMPVTTMDGLHDMAAWADVLVTCIPLHQDTHGVVDAGVLDRLGDGLLVHVARGPVVDEDALYTWLQRQGWAHIDVWWDYGGERPFHRPFHELGNVTMTPHNSPNVTGFRRIMLARACEDLVRLRDGEVLHVESRKAHATPTDGDGR